MFIKFEKLFLLVCILKLKLEKYISLYCSYYMQIYGDPEAADIVFTSGANIVVVGINITTQVQLTGAYNLFLNIKIRNHTSIVNLLVKYLSYNKKIPIIILDHDLDELRKSGGKHAQFLSDMIKFYRDWHVKSDGVYGNLLYIL